jgi:putative acetyltransferase
LNTHIEIRPYQATDLDDVIAIFLDAIKNIASENYSPEQIKAWAQVDRDTWSVRRMSRPTWVAEIDGTPAGWTDLEPDGHLDMLFVHSAFKRLGVASALLKKVESAARDLQLTRIFTEASLTARPVFERHGYTVIAEQSVFIRGEYVTNFRMEKILEPMRRRDAARLILLDQERRILLLKVRHIKGPHIGQFYWSAPGGAVDADETFDKAAVRELFEETGIKVDAVDQCIVEEKFVHCLPSGNQVFAHEKYFLVETNNPQITDEHYTEEEKQEIVGHKWWHFGDLSTTSEMLHPENLVAMLSRSRLWPKNQP